MATLTDYLADAQAAYHDLLTGKAVVQFRDQNGEVVIYALADKSQLAAYIIDLKAQIALAAGSRVNVGPLRTRF